MLIKTTRKLVMLSLAFFLTTVFLSYSHSNEEKIGTFVRCVDVGGVALPHDCELLNNIE